MKNLLLIDLDTMRADRLGCYGYSGRPTSARLDSILEERGFFIFRNTYSTSSWTLPATAKFFTSRYINIQDDDIIPRSYTTMAEILRKAGYYCIAFTGGGMLRFLGFEQGFHEYYWTETEGKVEDNFPDAISWLKEKSLQPFFLFLHTYEPHMPYTRDTFCKGLPHGKLGDLSSGQRIIPVGGGKLLTEPTREESIYIEAAYDGGVKAACDATADLLMTLDELDLWKDTVVIILSDHGEEFAQHSKTVAIHSIGSLYNELLSVPFMIYSPSTPEQGLKHISTEVSTADLLPTVGELFELPIDLPCDGISLLPLLNGESVERSLPILATNWPDKRWKGATKQVALISEGQKLIQPIDEDFGFVHEQRKHPYHPERALYMFESDPYERINRAIELHRTADSLAHVLRGALERALKPESHPVAEERFPIVSDDLARQLKALGYIDEE